MANKTIGQLTLATSALDADLIEFEIASSGLSRRITKANFIGATLTGGGAIATGGFTLTVPATGTAALIGLAQTFSALQTFSAGIKFANETLSVYREGSYTPAITASSSNPTVTYTTQTGEYIQIGKLVFANFQITINTFSGGSGNLRISLPIVVGSNVAQGNVLVSGVDVPASTIGLSFTARNGQLYGDVGANIDDSGTSTLTPTAFAAGDIIRGSVVYVTA